MKELSIEDKAKRYDEAIKYGQYLINERCKEGTNGSFHRADLDKMFPELAESEDNNIKKGIRSVLEHYKESGEIVCPYPFVSIEDCLAWLEKQGEPIDKEKVLIGARKDIALSIIKYLDNNSVGMCLSNMECEDIEDACINSKWTKLYNYMKKKLEKQGDKPFDYENANIQQKDFAPKSQRMMSAKAKEALYEKPAWSEEDEKMYLSIMSVLLSTIGTDKTGLTVTREMDWLKSLKDKVQSLSQPKEWSEEDERMRQYVVNDLRFVKELVNDTRYVVSVESVEKEIDWMESLKERIG